jgi:NAD(P)-dependent dehydrogenase (short-subunit alcohol dehydrogenase family)
MVPWTTKDIPNQFGKLAIVTGATGGLGLETALVLAGAGAEVVLAGRNPSKGASAEQMIRRQYKDANVRFAVLDLASLASVKEFSDLILRTARPVHILINNAGLMALPKRQVTVDGFEMQFGTNYLGHFALTARLLPLLTAGNARVVELFSIAHRSGKIRLDDLNYVHRYKAWKVYSQSKLAMLMFAIELDRRSRSNGCGLTSVAAHPGFARTDLMNNGPASGGSAVMRWLFDIAGKLFGHSAAEGALPSLMAATMPGVTGGQYFGPQGFNEGTGLPGPAKISPQAMDADVAAKLWSASEKLTGVAFG